MKRRAKMVIPDRAGASVLVMVDKPTSRLRFIVISTVCIEPRFSVRRWNRQLVMK